MLVNSVTTILKGCCMRYRKVPDETVRRLPLYLRGLRFFSEQSPDHVSSKILAEFLGINPWQVRKDLSYFGEMGTPGVGYKVKTLTNQIKRILRLDSVHNAVLVGVGNLGSAVLAYQGFRIYGIEIVVAYDSSPAKIGSKINGVEVKDISEMWQLNELDIDLGIISVPGGAAQSIADELISAGIKGILNLAPDYIRVPKKIKVISIDIAMDFARLPYYIPAS